MKRANGAAARIIASQPSHWVRLSLLTTVLLACGPLFGLTQLAIAKSR